MEENEIKVFNISVWPQIEVVEEHVRGRRHRNGEKQVFVKNYQETVNMFPTIAGAISRMENKQSFGPMEMTYNGNIIKVKVKRVG